MKFPFSAHYFFVMCIFRCLELLLLLFLFFSPIDCFIFHRIVVNANGIGQTQWNNSRRRRGSSFTTFILYLGKCKSGKTLIFLVCECVCVCVSVRFFCGVLLNTMHIWTLSLFLCVSDCVCVCVGVMIHLIYGAAVFSTHSTFQRSNSNNNNNCDYINFYFFKKNEERKRREEPKSKCVSKCAAKILWKNVNLLPRKKPSACAECVCAPIFSFSVECSQQFKGMLLVLLLLLPLLLLKSLRTASNF